MNVLSFRICLCAAIVVGAVVSSNEFLAAQEHRVQQWVDEKGNNVVFVPKAQDKVAQQKNEGKNAYYRVLAKNFMRQSSPEKFIVGVNEFQRKAEVEDVVDQSLISDFWIGVQCEKADKVTFSPAEAPNAQLKVEGGMKILAVTEGGAAKDAGVKEGDVLLRFAEKDMNSVNDLYAVIGEMGETENDAVFVREGKLVVLKIMPKRRPEPEEQEVRGLWTTDRALQYELDGSRLPKGYTLTIQLERGKNVVVTAAKGKESWSGDAESIEKLPDDVQPLAIDLVAKCKPVVAEDRVLWTMDVARNFLPAAQFQRLPVIVNNPNDRMTEIYKQLSELTEAVKALKEKIGD